MSTTPTIMKFESLPNEILIECFEYFNACDIFHSFDQLNHRLNRLIRHIPLCINFQDVNRSIFDEFCAKMLQNKEIKNQVYSLHLPAEHQCFQTKIFLSFFSYEEFSNLQTYESTLSLLPHHRVTGMRHDPELDLKIKRAGLLFSKLRNLSISQLDGFLCNTHEISSITKLTLSVCNLSNFYYLLEHVPMLKYLHINHINYGHDTEVTKSFNGPCSSHLKQLIIDNFDTIFEKFELYVKQIPNLKSLTISSCCIDMTDAYRWEQLITSSLPYLNIFKFKLSHIGYNENDDILVKYKQFQTDFWQKQHQWFTECEIREKSATIYTIPYISHTYRLWSDSKRYCNDLKNHVNTFINVTNLTLCPEMLTKNCEYYFSNVTSLELTPSSTLFSQCSTLQTEPTNNLGLHSLTQPESNPLITEHMQYLKMSVNLCNLKYLDISIYRRTSVLLEILKEAPQLFSLSIHWNQLTSILNDSELYKYLNKMIKRLYIVDDNNNLIADSFQAKLFCEIFSNIEHLQCIQGHAEKLVYLLDYLPKLSTLNFE